MTQETTMPSEVSFKDFLFKNKRNRTILILAAVAIVVQWGVFKYFYPFASYIHGDSFSYLNAAEKNLDISTYLIGYSKFLRLFSVFNRTDYVLTTFQYLFIQCSALYLLFTLFYFYKTGKTTQIILLCFMVFNPLFLHLGNLISSDGFFLALSLIWLCLLLWIIHKPSIKIIIWHAVILFIAFTVRYNAMLYPIISLFAFYLSKISWSRKLAGLGLAALLCGSFVGFTMFKYKKLTDYWQYSPFSGWQMANNAMYAYRYVNSVDRKPVPKKYQTIDNMIREFFDSTRDTNKFQTEKIQASTFYMWSYSMPLMKYKRSQYTKYSATSELKKWASMGPLYHSYGLYIIRQYPWHFIRYFLWPNLTKYYAPPVEFLESYNSGKLYVTNETKKWFGYKSINVNTRMKNQKVWVLDFYPILSGIINMAMLSLLFCYLLLKGWQYQDRFKNGILLGYSLWFINAWFTILASSAALRFQSFPALMTTIFVALMMDWMIQLLAGLKKQSLRIINDKNSYTQGLGSEAIA